MTVIQKSERERPKRKRAFSFLCYIKIIRPQVFPNTRRRLGLEDRGFKGHTARIP